MFKVALTGGIASGKSTVANLFRKHGVEVIDTDIIARDMVAPGAPALDEIRKEFGADVFDSDGSLNRKKLRAHIFETPAARERLNAILHPRIMQELKERLHSLHNQTYIIVEVPLLVEGGFEKDFDRILVIDVPKDIQIERLIARDDSRLAEARQAVAAQASRDERLAVADDIIVNDGSLEALAAEVDTLHARYREFARQAGRASE